MEVDLGVDQVGDRLWFGTASIGMPNYGHPRSGTSSDSGAVLDHVYKLGVRKFDTAANYGSAEQTLACLVSQHKDCKVSTKIGSRFYPDRAGSIDELISELERSLSLFSKIDTVYLHRSTPDVLSFDLLFSRLDQYMRNGDIAKVGASVYGAQELSHAIEHEQIDVIQVAGCILDWSLIRLCLGALDKKIVCRSVFLQGLLSPCNAARYHLPDGEVFDERLSAVTDLSARLGVNNGQLSFWFMMRAISGVDVVFGSRSITSVNENLAVLKHNFERHLFDGVMSYGEKSFEFMNPRLWIKK
jgi:aryl-alcohol dehydrogenase-like predicted oxidoreductase